MDGRWTQEPFFKKSDSLCFISKGLISFVQYLQATCGRERGGGWCARLARCELFVTIRGVEGGVEPGVSLPAACWSGCCQRGSAFSPSSLSLSVSLLTQVRLKLQSSPRCSSTPRTSHQRCLGNALKLEPEHVEGSCR